MARTGAVFFVFAIGFAYDLARLLVSSAPPPEALDTLEQALSGDPAAMRALVRLLRPILQGAVATTLLRYRGAARGRALDQEVDDLVQDVFVVLLSDGARELRRFSRDRGTPVGAYFRKVAIRRTISVLRSSKKSPFAHDPTEDAGEDLSPGSGADPEIQTLRHDLRARVLSTLRARLSTVGRAVFDLLFCEGWTVEEVSAALDMKPGAVHQWSSRITAMAREIAKGLVSA